MPEPLDTAARTPRMSLPFLYPAQAQKEAFVNQSLLRLDALIQPVVAGEHAAPPPDPAPGECHIVAAGAVDAWAGHEGQIAYWAANQWLFLSPTEGAAVFDGASGCNAFFSEEGGWRRAAVPGPVDGGATQDLEVRAALAGVVAALQLARILV